MIAQDYGMLTVGGSIPDDAQYLATRLRKADLLEIHESFPDIDPLRVFKIGMEVSKPFARTIRDHGEPIAMFGIVPTILYGKKTGVSWLLGTERIKANRMRFLRLTKFWILRLMEEVNAEQLFTQADCRNKEHIRWLTWAGFRQVGEPVKVGPRKRLFAKFLLVAPAKPQLLIARAVL